MSNMKAVTERKEIAPGMFVDPIMTGTSCVSLEVLDASGKRLLFVKEQYSSLVVLMPEAQAIETPPDPPLTNDPMPLSDIPF